MTVPMEFIMWILGVFGTLITAGILYIIRTQAEQGRAIAHLTGVLTQRVLELETDMARIWGIYDAWKGPSAPSGVERAGTRYGGS